MSAVDRVLERLEGVKRSGEGWEARCPAHHDRHASLSVGVGNDGRALLRCHAGEGCTVEAIVQALGLKVGDLFDRDERSNGRRVVAEYDYLDEQGTLLFQAVRFEPKGFAQRKPDGAGGWLWKTQNVRRVLYRLPAVLEAVTAGRTVYVVEGEKDVHSLEAAGVVATTSPMGAGKWRKQYATTLKGADVVVVQDRDEEGRKHAAAVVASLAGVASSVRLVEPAKGKDASDHLAAGFDVSQFTEVIADFSPFEDSETKPEEETTQEDRTHSVQTLSMARDELGRVMGKCFPSILDELFACLSVAATLLLEDQQNPVAANLEGVPSSMKTTLVDLFGKADDKVYRSDKFTPKSFVSHASAVARNKLDEIDLLPRIRHRLFLVPELAPLFGLRNEDLLENFSILTRVFDGHGLTTDSGIHGQRGHTGDYLFAWIGCTTPIEHRVWKTMGKLGSRLLFLEMPAEEQTNEELVADLAGGVSYRDRVESASVAVAGFLDSLWAETGGVRGVAWDRGADPKELMERIAGYAKVLARIRGTISVWREGSGEDETYNFSTPIIEGPQRAMSLLYALARGHALLYGRRQLEEADLAIVARAALESTPNDRRAVIRLLLTHQGSTTTVDLERALRCSAPTARAILETLDHLGVGTFFNPGPPSPGTLTLADDLAWLLDDEANPHKQRDPIERKLTPCYPDEAEKPEHGKPYPAKPSLFDELLEAGVSEREANMIARSLDEGAVP